jgi:hypothetical protein
MGVAAKLIAGSDGRMDTSNIVGATIGFSLHDGEAYDALAHGVTGFGFHIDSEPPPNAGILVQLVNTATRDSPHWGGSAGAVSPVHAGHNEFRWADVGGPFYLESPPRLDPTRLVSISFLVRPDPAAAKSFAFCINHLTALTN